MRIYIFHHLLLRIVFFITGAYDRDILASAVSY